MRFRAGSFEPATHFVYHLLANTSVPAKPSSAFIP